MQRRSRAQAVRRRRFLFGRWLGSRDVVEAGTSTSDIASSTEKISSDGFRGRHASSRSARPGSALDSGSFTSFESTQEDASKELSSKRRHLLQLRHPPNCDTKFNGTITVLNNPTHAAVDAKGNVVSNAGGVPAGQPGLIIQSGDAYIGGNINSGGNLNLSGTVTAKHVRRRPGHLPPTVAPTTTWQVPRQPHEAIKSGDFAIGGGSIAGAGDARRSSHDGRCVCNRLRATAPTPRRSTRRRLAQAHKRWPPTAPRSGRTQTVARAAPGLDHSLAGLPRRSAAKGRLRSATETKPTGQRRRAATADPEHRERYGSRRRRRQQ